MEASFDAMVVAAGFGAFWALVLGAVLALRRLAERARSPHPRRRRGATRC
jgi:hypothetical protein